MSFLDDNTAYETWLRTKCDMDEPGLVRKHGKMDSDPFPFLRATFFRWARQAEKICPDLKGAPSVLSVAPARPRQPTAIQRQRAGLRSVRPVPYVVRA